MIDPPFRLLLMPHVDFWLHPQWKHVRAVQHNLNFNNLLIESKLVAAAGAAAAGQLRCCVAGNQG